MNKIGYPKRCFQYLKEFCFQVLNIQYFGYVILLVFCLDQKLKIEADQLNDDIDWEWKQNGNNEKEQEVKSILSNEKQEWQALVKRKKV